MRICHFLLVFICFIPVSISAEEAQQTRPPGSESRKPDVDARDVNTRLDQIEKTLDNKALLDMLDQLESLKTEANMLRGKIEVQEHRIDQLKQKQRDLYTDTDRRLQRLESNTTETSNLPLLEAVESQQQGTENTPAKQTLIVETTTDLTADEQAQQEPKTVDPSKAEANYQRAFRLLKESRYEQALKAFKRFLQDYPDTAFSDNAQYWLGETHYVMQRYDLAINEYQALLNTYPDSQKIPHSLLKIGFSYAELGNMTEARETLKEVIEQYPGTAVARLADERLRTIGAATEPPP